MDLNPDLPTGDEKAEKVQGMFDRIAPRYDFVNRIMTFRLDVRWRKQTVQALELEKDSLVIDLACGTIPAFSSSQQKSPVPQARSITNESFSSSRA